MNKRLAVSVDNITAVVKVKGGKLRSLLTIQSRVEVLPGEICCVLGPSGCGKTTLLSILAGRLEQREFGSKVALYASVEINGINVDDLVRSQPRLFGFVPQTESLIGVLTVRELLHMTALLRSNSEQSTEEKIACAEAIMTQLGLLKVADSRIEALSGGERKRTSIGIELVGRNTPLLFLDEPTSGLDAFNSRRLLEILRSIADAGHTIICTLHQPTARMVSLCDKLLLMSAGRVIFFGTIAQATMYMAKLGVQIPLHSNPAELMLLLAHCESAQDERRIIRLSQLWEQFNETLQYPKLSQAELDHLWPSRASVLSKATGNLNAQNETWPFVDDAGINSSAAQPQVFALTRIELNENANTGLNPCHELLVLLKRHIFQVVRDPSVLRLRLLQYIFIAVLVGLVFLRIGNTQASIQARNGVMFFSLTNAVFGGVSSMQLSISGERPIVQRDLRSGAYRRWTYFLSISITELPMQTFYMMLTILITYWMVGLSNVSNPPAFWRFVFGVVLTAYTGVAFGLMIASSTKSATTAMAITPIVLAPLLIFAGFFINSDTIPKWLQWIQYVSMFYWGFKALSVSQYVGLTLVCTPSELIPSATPGGPSFCPFTTGEQVLARAGINPDQIVFFWAMLITLWLSFWLLAVIFFAFSSRAKGVKSELQPEALKDAVRDHNLFYEEGTEEQRILKEKTELRNSKRAMRSQLEPHLLELSIPNLSKDSHPQSYSAG
jgi:ABC-type multidrug transport system ATPase subunit/ABC-type multidrug transport system permease subunit/cbb3-type cytochrome oxidase subunit 3